MFKNLLNWRDANIESESYMQALREYKKLADQDFNNVKRRLGLDGATSFAHIYFSKTESMQRFHKELELQVLGYSANNKDYEIMAVVPDAQLGNETQNNKWVDQVTRMSLGCGFLNVSRVDLKGTSAIDGARQLAHLLKGRKSQKKFIMVSFSHASASVRIMLDQMNSFEWAKIQGWVNVSGLIFGSPLYFCSKKRSGIFSRNNELMRSYSSEQKYFLRPLKSYPFKTVHFIGSKLSSQMNIAEKRRYHFLKPWGPNDGLMAFSSYQRLKTPVVSVLGQGHSIDLESVSLTFSSSLCSMVGLIPKSASLKKWTRAGQKEKSVKDKSSNITY